MDVLTLKRDMPAIDGGKWISKAEIPELADARIKVRGHSSRVVQEPHSARLRALSPDEMKDGRPTPETNERLGLLILSDVLVESEGFTIGGKPFDANAIREALADPAFAPLASIILRASMLVDASRAARAEEIVGNS